MSTMGLEVEFKRDNAQVDARCGACTQRLLDKQSAIDWAMDPDVCSAISGAIWRTPTNKETKEALVSFK